MSIKLCIYLLRILLIISIFSAIAASLIIMIKYDYETDSEQKVWIGSKILTLKYLMKSNNKNIYPILNISLDGTISKYKDNYETLLKNSGKECTTNYKQCGILDTLGNLMCIPENEECPINEIIIDLKTEEDYYINQNYKVGLSYYNNELYNFYYTNTKINNSIISKIKVSNEIPKFINSDNLIFDEDTFVDQYPPVSDDDDDYDYDYDPPDWDDYSLKGKKKIKKRVKRKSLRKLLIENNEKDMQFYSGEKYWDYDYGNWDTHFYILNRFFDKINIDTTYKNISHNVYVGNFIGFINSEDLNKYSDLDLHTKYFDVFPNKTCLVFAYIFAILATGFITFFIISIFITVADEKDLYFITCFVVYPYFVFMIGFFSYALVEYSDVYVDNSNNYLANIKADPFIEDILRIINERHCPEILMLSVIILYSISIFFMIMHAFFTFSCFENSCC